jgi:murein L,D-transpeptidase YcbB/YkuD
MCETENMKLTFCVKALDLKEIPTCSDTRTQGAGCIEFAWRQTFSQTVSRWGLSGMFLVGLALSPCALAEYDIEPQRETVLAIQVQSPFIWLDEQGPKDFTIEMLSLAQDLGIAWSDMDAPNTPDVATMAWLDEKYTQLAVHLFTLIGQYAADNISLTAELVQQKHRAGQLAALVNSVLPRHTQVARLRAKIRQYQKMSTYVWPTMPETQLTLGQKSTEIAKLRWMLIQLNDLEDKQPDHYRNAIFDHSLSTALKHFQQRHDLEPSGELDSQTLQALNVSPIARIAQMQRTLLRWFALPASLPEAYIWINLPSFRLDVIEKESSVLSMKVIVGKPTSPTPQLVTQLTQVTVNPTWTPPTSIIYGELLSQHSSEPGYLASRGFELRKISAGLTSVIELPQLSRQRLTQLLSEYQLVQAAGDHNALGKFRFAIPNSDAIYLHDTPGMPLFSEHDRALSHGCVRLEDASELLNYLLSKNNGLNPAHLRAAIKQDLPRHFYLSDPLAVFLTYHTSWVDTFGLLQLRADIYDLDLKQMN